MENQEKDGKACCDKSKCCGGKALAAVALLAVGGIGGYLASRCCKNKTDAPAAAAAPAQPAK